MKIRKITVIITAMLVCAAQITALAGCGKPVYKLNFDGYGFESKKTEYAAGDKVTVRYDIIATDTDYRFRIDEDVDMKQDYDGGYVFTFTMPAHDVTIHVESYSSMEYTSETIDISELSDISEIEEIEEKQILFDYYRATVATVGGDGYDEFVLYERDDSYLYLVSYSKWGEQGSETKKACLVPYSVLDDCMYTVGRYAMAEWTEGIAVTGAFYVVKFPDPESPEYDRKLLRITSDVAPDGDLSAFNEIEAILSGAWAENATDEQAQD